MQLPWIGLVVVAMVAFRVDVPEERLRVGDPFPVLGGQFLTGRTATLPQAASGTIRLVAMGFTYQSRFPVEALGEWYRTTIGPDAGVTVFEVPMIGGFATLGRWFIDRGMRRGTPAEFHEDVIIVYRGANSWKRRLAYAPGHEDDAYLIVLDGGGIVRWLHRGLFDEATADELRGVLASLVPTRTVAGQVLPDRRGIE